MAKTLDLQPSKIVMTDEDTLAAYTIYAHNEGIDIDTEIRPNVIHAPANSDLQILSEPGYRLSLMTDAMDEVLGYDNDDGIISMPKQSGCRVYLNGSNQSIPNDAHTKVAFNAVSYDIQNEYDASTDYRFTAKKSGYYYIRGQVLWANFVDQKAAEIWIVKNGLTMNKFISRASNDGAFSSATDDILYLDADDYIEIHVWQKSGDTRDILYGSVNTFLVIHKLA